MARGVKTGGRKKGVGNKTAQDVRELAQKFGPQAIATLGELVSHPEPSTRIAASKELLDRAYGKAPQAQIISGDPNAPVKHEHVLTFKSGV